VIRIRYERSQRNLVTLEPSRDVTIIDDESVIACESEKNQPTQREAVDLHLRPIFEHVWRNSVPPFHVVSIETRAGCNYSCNFCPVGRHFDPREPGEMSWFLLKKIASELAAMNYAARIGLFGNNEPLLDPRLPEIVSLLRTNCPNANLRILTNGTYVNASLVIRLFEAGLSTLVINNYTDGRRLIRPIRTLFEEAPRFKEYDIRVSVRSRTDVLTTRAGMAPNKPRPSVAAHGFCALPFTDLYVNYRGKVNLCCFDAHGLIEIGDVSEAPIWDIWRSPLMATYRSSLLQSVRRGLTLCENCDYDGFREPAFHPDIPMTRSDIPSRINHFASLDSTNGSR
jgi:MoaA/NifB/PqqE/SkfB family radical SAM enzyme